MNPIKIVASLHRDVKAAMLVLSVGHLLFAWGYWDASSSWALNRENDFLLATFYIFFAYLVAAVFLLNWYTTRPS